MPDLPVTLANWRTAPHNRWAFHHVRELLPTADIPSDPRRIRELPARPREFPALERLMDETDADGLAVVHRGALVFERYRNAMSDETPHILMSVSKAMLGLLVARLPLDPERLVTDFVPEVKDTAYAGATLRHLLDMRAAVAFDEDYLATTGPIIEYRKATGWNPLAPGETPSDLHAFYAVLQERAGVHGGPVRYVSPNTDLLGWVIERASGQRYAELMSEQVWKPAGAERSAYITLDRLGAPRSAGGMCATLRDLARAGLWMIESAGDFLRELEARGDAQAWVAGNLAPVFPTLQLHYRNHWYVLEGPTPLVFGWGIHGQFVFVDRARELVVAQLASQALPVDAKRMMRSILAVCRLREALEAA